MMWKSMSKYLGMPPQTRVFCAHEYTASNASSPFPTLLGKSLSVVAWWQSHTSLNVVHCLFVLVAF